MSIPRLIIAGLSGDSGKTLVSLSVVTALRRRGFSVSVFKKGPDYIDSAWLSWAGDIPCRNLDTHMVGSDDILRTFTNNTDQFDIAIVEGNRGLFDGGDALGTHSTASLAKLLEIPVILVVNCSKTTRTLAAIINGCNAFDPDLKIAGVVLNQVAGKRHETVITESIAKCCDVPVLGAIPRQRDDAGLIPGRHLGLITPSEFESNADLEIRLAEIADKHIDIDRLVETARSAGSLQVSSVKHTAKKHAAVKVGYFRDTVFTFYYPENLEELKAHGAELVPVSSLDDTSLPDLDALYIGGGFPEVHAERLASNQSLMNSVRKASKAGLPIYAECGGLIYLSKSIAFEGKSYPMAGVFNVELRMDSKPVGHGYSLIRVDRPCPFFPTGIEIRGHEFHYSGPITNIDQTTTCMAVEKGVGLGNGRDGLLENNTLASYTHIHALGITSWATSMVASARDFQEARSGAAMQSTKTNAHSDITAEPLVPVKTLTGRIDRDSNLVAWCRDIGPGMSSRIGEIAPVTDLQ